MTKGLVSIIITTKNEESVIERLLISLKKQDYKDLEIILVDNNSSDRTKYIAKKYTNNIFDFGPERSAQRNLGAKNSKGKFLLVLDADMQLSSDVVAQCVKAALKDKRIGAVAVPEESVANSFWEKVKAHERAFYNEAGDGTTDAARFFRKEAFEKVGGYDETITGPEDWDLPENIIKHGFKQARVSAKIYHYERVPNPIRLAKKKYYYALTSHRYLKKHNIAPISAKTIYFLRPIFYKNWRRLVKYPFLSIGMITMFILEQFGGGLGYFVGKYKKL